MLLSIVIPAYDRPAPLKRALDIFIDQIEGKYNQIIELIVVDDCSPQNTLQFAAEYSKKHEWIQFKRNDENIGLERNLVACTTHATGEFLWIFGDDDYLETNTAMDEIIRRLKAGATDMLIMNRTRRTSDLTTLLTSNWMEIEGDDRQYSGLREFMLEFGYLSVIGFISVNIFRRKPYQSIDIQKYLGTMYPQLGAMVEAFSQSPITLVTLPMVCHRTQTADEKRASLGTKQSEADFMADYERRNALYFSHPHVAMLDRLISKGALLPEDVLRFPENTVINGLLIDFLINCVEKSLHFPERFNDLQWRQTEALFNRLPLDTQRRKHTEVIFAKRKPTKSEEPSTLTISVVTPSFNQAEFLGECLQSVRDQSYPALEHLVFDPGSRDASRAIAKTFPHVTLSAEHDNGQSDAVNKGWARAKGDIVAWLNSDDMLHDPEVFKKVVARFNAPDQPDIVYGRGIYINETGQKLRDIHVNKDPSSLPWKLQQECGISQPALFMRREVIQKVGYLIETNHFCMDYEYWIRCTRAGLKFVYLDDNLSIARYHTSNKTYGQRGKSYAEVCKMLYEHFAYVNHFWLRRFAEFLADGHDGVLAHAQNSGVRDAAKLELEYNKLLMKFNCGVAAYSNLHLKAKERGYGDTAAELKKRCLDPARAAADGIKAYAPAVVDPVRQLPSIALVTPNFNTAAFVDATIQSVLCQSYPKLQYVVIDGASTDGSQAIVQKRRDSLHAFVSEPDRGHADAINKGFALTNGEIMGWLNSDDILLPGALDVVARVFADNPDVEWITGRPSTIDENGGSFQLHALRKFSRLRFLSGHYKWIQQESTFWRRSLWNKAGGSLNTSVKLAVDMDLWIRFFRHAELHAVDIPLGAFRQRKGQRSIAFKDAYESEAANIISAEAKAIDDEYRYWFSEVLPTEPVALSADELAKLDPLLAVADTPNLPSPYIAHGGANRGGRAVDTVRLTGEDWRRSLARPDDISSFKDIHLGQRCFVMGNGPSLNKMNLDKLSNEIVFGCNSVFLLFDRVGWRPTYYTCVDSRVLPDRRADIRDMLENHPSITAFFPSQIRQYTGEKKKYLTRTIIPPGDNRYFFLEGNQSSDDVPFSMFSTDANKKIIQPFTVTITMLQLAYYMGFKEVYLIGCDTSYVIPDGTIKEGLTPKGDLGLALTSVADHDPNHFDPRYFGKGRQWHDPQTDKMIEHYRHAKSVCDITARTTIFNATVGGNLDVFRRVDFDSLFSPEKIDRPLAVATPVPQITPHTARKRTEPRASHIKNATPSPDRPIDPNLSLLLSVITQLLLDPQSGLRTLQEKSADTNFLRAINLTDEHDKARALLRRAKAWAEAAVSANR